MGGQLTNQQRIKCLFGYHKYDEFWSQNIRYRDTFKICSWCRRVGVDADDPILPSKTYNMIIVEESPVHFLVKCLPRGAMYFYKKKYQGRLGEIRLVSGWDPEYVNK